MTDDLKDLNDPDAALVLAVLQQLRTVPEPERVMNHDLPGLPRTKVGWIRLVLRAMRDAGVDVRPPDAGR